MMLLSINSRHSPEKSGREAADKGMVMSSAAQKYVHVFADTYRAATVTER